MAHFNDEDSQFRGRDAENLEALALFDTGHMEMTLGFVERHEFTGLWAAHPLPPYRFTKDVQRQLEREYPAGHGHVMGRFKTRKEAMKALENWWLRRLGVETAQTLAQGRGLATAGSKEKDGGTAR